MMKLSHWVENIVGKGENAWNVTSIFSFSHIVFKRPVSESSPNLGLCGKELNEKSDRKIKKMFVNSLIFHLYIFKIYSMSGN